MNRVDYYKKRNPDEIDTCSSKKSRVKGTKIRAMDAPYTKRLTETKNYTAVGETFEKSGTRDSVID